MNWLKAMTSVDNCFRSTRPCGRDVRWLECSRRVVRLREERGGGGGGGGGEGREERKRGGGGERGEEEGGKWRQGHL